MKILLINFLLLSLAYTQQISVVMDKGSIIKGDPDFKELLVSTEYGKLKIPLDKISSIHKEEHSFRVSLINGEVAIGKLDLKSFGLKTLIGDLSVELDRMKSLVVLKNKVSQDKEGWSKIVNGLALKLISSKYIQGEEESYLNLSLKIKNFSKDMIQFPEPEINRDNFNNGLSDSEELFFIDYKRIDGEKESMVVCGGPEAALQTLPCALSPGKTFDIEIKVKVVPEDIEQEAEELEERLRELDAIRVLETTALISKGKYIAKISMKNFFQNNVWIKEIDGKPDIWSGLIEVSTPPFEFK